MLQVRNSPIRHLLCHNQSTLVSVAEETEGINRLGCGLNIYWVKAIVVITGRPGGLKEIILEVEVAPLKVAPKRIVSRAFGVTVYAVEIICCVEVVDPVILFFFAIPP